MNLSYLALVWRTRHSQFIVLKSASFALVYNVHHKKIMMRELNLFNFFSKENKKIKK
jgi:hypothetical protein